ncbi:MAG TPA: DinB family protein [Bryobacteraceae bacterium]|nr:DinB family protein [Bryobacteraceae bacterium]
MEIRDPGEFLNYFNKVHQRTMNVVRVVPPDKVDWRFREGKFTLGDLVRHIATTNRYMFLEVALGRPSAYGGCGKELAATYDEIVSFSERLHREAVEILSGISHADLEGRCITPDGASITTWKWLRSMVEHEIHHRGQIYIYLSLLETPTPPLYGLTSEQLIERSVPRA